MTHHHHHSGEAHPSPRPAPSLLRLSGPSLVLIALAPIAAIWALIAWAMN
jgi:hypothetical protein